MSVPAEPQVVRIKDVADIATAIPHMLGFRPTRSLVAVALRRPRDRMSFTMRLDLLPAGHDVEVAQDVAMRMRHARADAMLLVLYTARGDRATLPRDPLVRAVARASSVPMRDALLVDDGRVWSYLCDDVRCCPPEGRLLDAESPGATALAAAHALQGDVILPDRDALVATTRAIGGIAAESMAQAQERVVARLLADAPASLDVERSLLVLDEIARRHEEPPVDLSHDDAAEVAVRVHDLRVRDALLQRAARGHDATVMLIRAAARLAQPPDDAPIASMLALCGYLRGDGVVAVAAAERALDTDGDYSLAQLVLDCVTRQLDPREVRRVWAAQEDDTDNLT